MSRSDCLFCRKLSDLDALPAEEVVWRFPHGVALLGTWQYYHGYCLLIARRHATELSGLGAEERREYLVEMCLLARAIEEAFRPRKIELRTAGQSGPAPALAPVPARRPRRRRAEAGMAGAGPGGTRRRRRRRLETGPRDRAATADEVRRRLQLLAHPPYEFPPSHRHARQPLALWQANHVADRLRPLAAPRLVELVVIETSGDVVRDLPLAQIGGDGVFTKEIQRALLMNVVDVAVHSLKDLPTIPIDGLTLGAVPRAAPSATCSCRGGIVASTPCRPAPSSPPAVCAGGAVLHRRPDLQLAAIRGNVETRLRKLDEGGLDAIILRRPGWSGWAWRNGSRRFLILPGCFRRSVRAPSVWSVGPTMRRPWRRWRR